MLIKTSKKFLKALQEGSFLRYQKYLKLVYDSLAKIKRTFNNILIYHDPKYLCFKRIEVF